MTGELCRVMSAQWKSELDNVVLEVPDENNPKISNDSERCSWNQLLSELSDSGISDATINSHELSTPIVEGGKVTNRTIHSPLFLNPILVSLQEKKTIMQEISHPPKKRIMQEKAHG